MTILDRYVLNTFGRILALALGAFASVYLLVDFFEKIDNFLSHQAQLSHYIIYYACKLPQIVVQVMPLAVLLAVFLTLGGFSRSCELTAMRAGGISLWRIVAPLLVTSLLAAGAMLAANEFLIPLSARTMHYIYEVEVKGKQPFSLRQENLWYKDGEAIVHIRLARPDARTLEGVSIFQIDRDSRLVARIDARHAVYAGDGWQLHEGTLRRYAVQTQEVTGVETFAQRRGELTRTPDDFVTPAGKNQELGMRELARMAQRMEAEGYDATRFRVDLHALVATPFACLVMAFLGIPFALRKGRGTSIAIGVAISVAIGVAYFILQATLQALGYSSVLPAPVAAWAANVLFGLLGVWMLLIVRE